MCKLYRLPVEVHPGPDNQPFSFAWKGEWHLIERGFHYSIKLCDHQWYRSMGLDPYRERFRCMTDDGIDCDLVQEKDTWILERVWD